MLLYCLIKNLAKEKYSGIKTIEQQCINSPSEFEMRDIPQNL